MLFNSFEFAIFFPLVAVLYFLLPHKTRWLWLLLASAYFYMAFIPKFILVLVFLILVDYVAGLLIERAEGKKRKWILILSLTANLGILFFFKYFNFAQDSMHALGGWLGFTYNPSLLSIILPLGLSFHTFQSMSYTIEVYYGRQKAERHLGIYSLYVLFFPQLVAGPIERPQNLLHQLRAYHRPEYENITHGLKLIFTGLFKKIIIADTLASFVNITYGDLRAATNLQILLATYFFTFQIFCDFSGYSDIARGSARILGIDLMKNFEKPYLATSIAGFWQRWHISLSTWFKDYVYIPLGGNRHGEARTNRNLLVVFLLSGLWHGANWTYVAWGLWHGLALVGARILKSKNLFSWKLPMFIKGLITFHIVVLGWVLFRATSLSDAWYVFAHLLPHAEDFQSAAVFRHITPWQLALNGILIFGLMLFQYVAKGHDGWEKISRRPTWQRWAFYYAAAGAFLFFISELGQPTQAQQFIYFQF